jgi:hypothetical protein
MDATCLWSGPRIFFDILEEGCGVKLYIALTEAKVFIEKKPPRGIGEKVMPY